MIDNENNQVETISGTVENIIFYSDETEYCVVEISNRDEIFVVVGILGNLSPGEHIECSGDWINHKMYGPQFNAESVIVKMPYNDSALLKYLSSTAIKGIGKKMAENIVNTFRGETIEVLLNYPERLAKVKGIGKSKAYDIQRDFNDKYQERQTIIELLDLGLSPNEAVRVFHIYNTNSLEEINKNPYSLIGSETRISFDTADKIREKLLNPVPEDYRIQAGIIHILNHNLNNGHSCVPKEKIYEPACNFLGCTNDEIDIAIENAIENKTVVIHKLNNKEFLFLAELFRCEQNIADKIAFMSMNVEFPVDVFNSEIRNFEKINNIEFDDKQREAIKIALNKKFLILTGGPGTGKTTTIIGIIGMMKNRGLRVSLIAPTGRAAQRMEELTGYGAKTIHRFLEVTHENDKLCFVHNEHNKIDVDAVIVDELSMIDVTLFSSLLDALPSKCKLIMVGDKNQLPPVGAGNVLADLISSNIIDTITLDKIFRQAQKSKIVTNAHKVINGEEIEIANNKDSDFFFLKEYDEDKAREEIVNLVVNRLPKGYGYNPVNDIQVLCAGKKGALGCESLNALLQLNINPPSKNKKEVKRHAVIFREGDRVMQVKNDYDIEWVNTLHTKEGTGVFNGDIGILSQIDFGNKRVYVTFSDKIATYGFENLNELDLAYAMSVHKSQGSEFNAVIMPVMSIPAKLTYRNLFYTAITRAKETLVLIGNEDTISNLIKNDKKARRYSSLSYLIEENKNAMN